MSRVVASLWNASAEAAAAFVAVANEEHNEAIFYDSLQESAFNWPVKNHKGATPVKHCLMLSLCAFNRNVVNSIKLDLQANN